jgi:excisionase family DNA binding protein
MEPLMLRKEVSKLVRRKESWLRWAERKGLIPFVRVGREIRYRRADIEAWLDAHKAGDHRGAA